MNRSNYCSSLILLPLSLILQACWQTSYDGSSSVARAQIELGGPATCSSGEFCLRLECEMHSTLLTGRCLPVEENRCGFLPAPSSRWGYRRSRADTNEPLSG